MEKVFQKAMEGSEFIHLFVMRTTMVGNPHLKRLHTQNLNGLGIVNNQEEIQNLRSQNNFKNLLGKKKTKG